MERLLDRKLAPLAAKLDAVEMAVKSMDVAQSRTPITSDDERNAQTVAEVMEHVLWPSSLLVGDNDARSDEDANNNAGGKIQGAEVAAGLTLGLEIDDGVAGGGPDSEPDPAALELKNDMRSLLMLLRRDGL